MTRFQRLVFAILITITTFGQDMKIYQAEAADFYNAEVETEHVGFTGEGYVNFDNETGSYIEFAIAMAATDSQIVTITYANGASNARPMSVLLNEVELTIAPQFSATDAWTNWSSDSLIIFLNEGMNTLRFTSQTSDGGPNLDKITVTGTPGVMSYNLNVTTIGTGSVKVDPDQSYYTENSRVELTASADSGWQFLEWRGDTSSTVNPITLTMNANKDIIAVFTAELDTNFQWQNEPVGFATVDTMDQNGTSGGAGGDTIIVETGSQLNEIMLARKDAHFDENNPPLILLIRGHLTWDEDEMLDVKETYDLSIIGESKDAIIEGFGLNLYRSHNIIIQNIEFRDCPDDCINIKDTKSHHIWIDHCTFSDGDESDPNGNNHDGLLDIKSGASFITVSWCHFYNHQKTNLIGHSDGNGNEDTGRLKVSYHHNWWENTGSRHPRVRFGEVHVFNNYYDNSEEKMGYGIASTMEADVVVEGNYFYKVDHPTHCGYAASAEGDLVEINNIYDNSGEPETRGTAFNPSDYYEYQIDDPTKIPNFLTAFSGSGKINQIDPVAIDDDEIIAKNFILEQNYPNPFNPETIINYHLPKTGIVVLNIYDITGRKITTLLNTSQLGGKHSLKFDASDLAGGLYFYHLRYNGQSQTRKMMLLK